MPYAQALLLGKRVVNSGCMLLQWPSLLLCALCCFLYSIWSKVLAYRELLHMDQRRLEMHSVL
jgi:hypothetical protein